MTTPPPLAIEEYRALRATIRERGTLRLFVTAITVVAWAALSLALLAVTTMPAMTLVPLTVLAAGFEVVFAAHVSVERIGRYLAARYETPEAALPDWERAIADVGGRAGQGSGIDALFSLIFVLATAFNLIPLVVIVLELPSAPAPAVILTSSALVAAHLAFIARILHARRYAAGQRARDAELFANSRPR